MADERITVAEARAQEIAERAAAKALHDGFRLLGFDLHEITDVNALRDDFRFIRQQRSQAELRRSEAFKSAISALVGGIIGMTLSLLTWLITVLRQPS